MENSASDIHNNRQQKIENPRAEIEKNRKPILDSLRNFNYKNLMTRKSIKRAVIACICAAFGIPLLTYVIFASSLKDKQSIMNRNNAGVQLQDDKGEVFYSFNHPKDIEFVPLSNISKNVQDAAVAAEDKDFFKNPGFSPRGIARAFFNNLESGSIKQGGSTITQQLVKNSLLNSNRNILRKYQELILALEIERRFSKQDILEMYLNSIYFGEGSFGIENASQKYFAKSAKDLDLAQSSLLIALLPAPTTLSPITGDAAAAKKHQELVLSQMLEQNYITQAQKETANSEKLTFAPPPKEEPLTIAPHFALMVKDFLINKYGEEKITRSGYIVKTSLNRKWQQTAQTTVANQVARLNRNKATNGATVVEDPKTGQIKALVGSYDWNDDKFGKVNMAITPRQPGSSFKPIIYARALEKHLITPSTVLDDSPIKFGTYEPKDFDKKFRGKVTVRRALANSLNVPAVHVMDMVGVSDGIDTAKRLGITTLNDKNNYGLSLVLGSGEVKLTELTNVYATFGNGGVYNEPNYILEIKDKYGKTIFNYEPKTKSVISDGVSYLITSILTDNNARAEEFGNALTIGKIAAVKTGTTENFRDALTLGYTPNLAIGVWVGNNDNKPMDNIAGSLGAAPIWTTLMSTFLSQIQNDPFVQPTSVIVKQICNDANSPFPTPSPSQSASQMNAYKEFFLKGTEPDECLASSPTPTSNPTPTPNPTATDQVPEPTPASSPAQSPTPTLIPSPIISILPSP